MPPFAIRCGRPAARSPQHLSGLDAFLDLWDNATAWDWHSELVRSDKGKIQPLLANALTALRLAPEWSSVLAFNERIKQSETYLGAQFRRLRTRLGSPVAIKAMPATLARLVSRMLRYGMRYVDRGAQIYEEQHRQRQIIFLKRKLQSLA